MMWIAKMNDGTIQKEFDSGKQISFSSLNLSDVNEFKISESGSEVIVPFSSDSGILRFPNFHLDKLNELTQNTELKLIYDAEQQVFKLDEESLKLYNELMVTDESVFASISFDQTGEFCVDGKQVFLSYKPYDSDLIEFRNQPPYTNIIHYKDAITDFIGAKNTLRPQRRVDTVISYAIGYNKTHIHNALQFNLSLKIIYGLVSKQVTLYVQVTANDNINGKFILNYGDKMSELPCYLQKNQPVFFERVLYIM